MSATPSALWSTTGIRYAALETNNTNCRGVGQSLEFCVRACVCLFVRVGACVRVFVCVCALASCRSSVRRVCRWKLHALELLRSAQRRSPVDSPCGHRRWRHNGDGLGAADTSGIRRLGRRRRFPSALAVRSLLPQSLPHSPFGLTSWRVCRMLTLPTKHGCAMPQASARHARASAVLQRGPVADVCATAAVYAAERRAGDADSRQCERAHRGYGYSAECSGVHGLATA